MVDTTHKPLARELDQAPIRQKTPTQPPFLADGSSARPVLSAESVYTNKILDALIADVEIDKAMADAMMRGAGYLRFNASGAQHVPYDDVRMDHGADSTSS